jgi:hypothetical protein
MRLAGVTAIALAVLCLDAEAQRVRLDDSPSPVDTVPVDFALESRAVAEILRAGATAATERATGRVPSVEVRLDTRAFVGQTARIYLTMPAAFADAADLELSWEAGGRFLSGSARPGQSTLVFEGQVDEPLTSAVFSFVLQVGERAGSQKNRMEIFYELETLP